MQVTFKNMLMSYTGKCDGIIYYYHPRYNRIYARRLPQFKPTVATERLGKISSQLKALKVSEGYRNDLKIYCQLYQSLHQEYRYPCWSNMFTKIFWALAKTYNVDLSSITRTQIEAEELPVRSVKEAVAAGLIPEVPGWEYLEQEI